MVEIIETAYGMSWKSRQRSWTRKDEVEVYLPKTSEKIYMPQIAGQKWGNVIDPHHHELR